MPPGCEPSRQLFIGIIGIILTGLVLYNSTTSIPTFQPLPHISHQNDTMRFPFIQEYEDLFRKMMVDNVIPKRFVLYDPPLQLSIGWGNRFLSLCFLFMYCLLTDRVLLFSERSSADIAELFEPPPGIEWSFDKVASMFIGYLNLSGWWLIDDHPSQLLKSRAWLCNGSLARPYHFVVYRGNSYNHYLLPQNPKYTRRIEGLFGTSSNYRRMRRVMRYLFARPKRHYTEGAQHLQTTWHWNAYKYHLAVQFRTFRGDLSYKYMKTFTPPAWTCMINYITSLRLDSNQTLIFYTTDDKTMIADGIHKLSPFGTVVMNSNVSGQGFKVGVLDWLILSQVDYLITTGTTYPMTSHYVADDKQVLFVAGRHQFGSPSSNQSGIWCDVVPKPGRFPPVFDDIAMPMTPEELPSGISCLNVARSGYPTFMEGGRMVIRRDESPQLSALYRNRTLVHFLVNWCRRKGMKFCTPHHPSMFRSLTDLHWNAPE